MRGVAGKGTGDPLPIPHPTDLRGVQNRWEHVKLPADALAEIGEAQQNVLTALDYVAHELREALEPEATNKLYFPVAEPDQSIEEFQQKVERLVPHLRDLLPRAVEEIVALQHYGGEDFGWLSTLKGLNNPTKHEGLLHTHVVQLKGKINAPGYEPKDFEFFALNAGRVGDPRAFTERAAEAVLEFVRRMQVVMSDADEQYA